MTVKTTGAEFKRFYDDQEFWPDGGEIYHDDEYVGVNGVPWAFTEETRSIPDDAKIEISDGMVFNIPGIQRGYEPSLETYFRRWIKKQKTASILVECPIEKKDAVLAAIKAAGGKVAS